MSKNDFKVFFFLVFCIIMLGLASAVKSIKIPPPSWRPAPTPAPELTPLATPEPFIPQFVLISFDGSKSIDAWKDVRALKAELAASSTDLNVTHFINMAYFLTSDTRNQYQAPDQEVGKSNIGISDGIEDIHARINEVNAAVADGDEIAVHTVGHFSGLHWSKDDWVKEITSFNTILFGLDKMYPDSQLPALNLASTSIIGFRAPYLDHDQNLYVALHTFPQYRYDSSEVSAHNSWPTKDSSGLWHIPLGMMEYGSRKKHILAMDYNLYFYDTEAKSIVKKGTPEWDRIYKDTLDAFLGYFEKNYHSTRAPVLVGYHFSHTWNDGSYWEAMKTFARKVCGKPEVKCVTFRELVDYLDAHRAPSPVQTGQMTAAANEAAAQELLDDEHNE